MDYTKNEYIKLPKEFLADWEINFVDKGEELVTRCLFNDCDSDYSDQKLGHLYISALNGQYNCKKCGVSGNLITLAKHLGKDVISLFQYPEQGKLKPREAKSVTKTEDTSKDLTSKAIDYHKNLSTEHRQYFISRGISEPIIDSCLLGECTIDETPWLTIPIFNKDSKAIFFKYRRTPEQETINPTKYKYPKGAEASLYGIEQLFRSQSNTAFITEGELDSLVLRDWGYTSVSSTGGASTFKESWTEHFKDITKIYFCFDNDEVGKREAIKHAKLFKNKDVYIIEMPLEAGVKDITDFKLKNNSKEDFESLVSKARKFDNHTLEFSGIEFTEALKEFLPSQFFTTENAYFTLKLTTKQNEEVSSNFFVIGSDKHIVPLPIFLREHGYIIDRDPKFIQRWSTESLNAFLDGKDLKSPPIELLDKTVSTLKNYLDLGHEDWYLVLALWIWGTYFYRIFRSFPYFNINGLMSSGKTKLLELSSELAFNGKFLMGSTPAFVIREIHENCSTIFLDEVESLKKANTPEAQTLLVMLNTGYKIGPKLGKMLQASSKGWDPKEYDPYSPKMIAGINDIADTLQSRSINLTMLASTNSEIKNKELDIALPIFQELRDGFYLSAMNLYGSVHTTYKTLEEPLILGRNWEVWRPLFTLAKVIDEKSDQNLIYNLVRDFALERIHLASNQSADDQTIIQLLLALKEMMESDNKQETFYPIVNLKTYLKEERSDEFDWLESTKYIGTALKRAGVIFGGSEIRRFGERTMRGYVLNLAVINERLKALGYEYTEIK